MKRTCLVIAGIAVSLLLAAYIGLWIYSAKWFTQEIDKLYASTKKDGVVFLGEKPRLSNFPFAPEVRYTHGIQSGNFKLLFPELLVRGYPLPYTNLHLSFPQGVAIGGIVDEAIWNLHDLEAEISIPRHLPASFYQEDLAAWEAMGGNIDVKHYRATKDSLQVVGSGFLSLDKNLQPAFTFKSTLTGYDAFISQQKDKGLIEPFGAAIGMTVLNSLSKTDNSTGEKSVTVDISIQNQMLSVGPIQALPLPLIVWDTRKTPALLQ